MLRIMLPKFLYRVDLLPISWFCNVSRFGIVMGKQSSFFLPRRSCCPR